MLLHPPHILPLLQCGVSYMGTVLQEQTSPVCVPLVPSRSLTLSVLSTDCTYPCWCVGYSMDICSNVAMSCRGTAYFITVLSTGCREISAVASGAPPPPPSLLTLLSVALTFSSPPV